MAGSRSTAPLNRNNSVLMADASSFCHCSVHLPVGRPRVGQLAGMVFPVRVRQLPYAAVTDLTTDTFTLYPSDARMRKGVEHEDAGCGSGEIEHPRPCPSHGVPIPLGLPSASVSIVASRGSRPFAAETAPCPSGIAAPLGTGEFHPSPWGERRLAARCSVLNMRQQPRRRLKDEVTASQPGLSLVPAALTAIAPGENPCQGSQLMAWRFRPILQRPQGPTEWDRIRGK